MAVYTPEEISRMAGAAVVAASNVVRRGADPEDVIDIAEVYLEWIKRKTL